MLITCSRYWVTSFQIRKLRQFQNYNNKQNHGDQFGQSDKKRLKHFASIAAIADNDYTSL